MSAQAMSQINPPDLNRTGSYFNPLVPMASACGRELKTRHGRIDLARRTAVMAVLNVTPDSFFDGGRHFDTGRAIADGLAMAQAGADIIDIGGESSRPAAIPVAAAEELARVLPVIQGLRRQCAVPISIDSYKAPVARAALDAGADMVNDISALGFDAAMAPLVASEKVPVILMHMQGTPQTMQDQPHYDDVVADVHDFLQARTTALIAAGIDRAQICLDPGIGFGKTHEHNTTLMANCRRFHDLGCPLLVGHSRKAFIGKLIGNKDADRTPGTIGGALAVARQGVQIIRVHDVAAVRQALILFEACGGLE
jgi:dihydropteroate synthase